MASPIYLSTKPPCSWMMSVIAERYSFMKYTRSGGASASEIDENPARSEKNLVTLRPPSTLLVERLDRPGERHDLAAKYRKWRSSDLPLDLPRDSHRLPANFNTASC